MPDPTGRISHRPEFHRGVSWKQPCRVATTANIVIATALNAGDVLDGVTLAAGDRVLVKDQTVGAENGIYYAGVTPARDFDMDQDGTTTVTAEEVMGALVYIIAGTVNTGKLYRNTNTTAPTLGTTALTFTEVSGGASFATPAIVLSTAAAAGAAATVIRSDSTIAAFDATVPVTQAYGDAAATGSAAFAARRDHKHGMPATGVGTLLASITAASAAIANTETVVVSASIAANTLAVGQSFRIRGAGVGTTGAAPGNDTFRIRIGTTTLTGTIPTSVVAAANTSVTAQPFTFEALVTIRTITASGTVIGECEVEGDNVATGLFTLLQALSATTATVAVDSTVANLLELTFQSGAASSNATFHVATIESLVAVNAGSASAGALVLLEQHTASASATLDFTTFITSTYDEYLFEVVGLVPATGSVDLWMRMSTDGGSTYDAGNNYSFAIWGFAASGTVNASALTQAAIPMRNAAELPTTSTLGACATVRLFHPASTALYKRVQGQFSYYSNATNLVNTTVAGVYSSTTAVNAFRFLFSSGNITSGTIRVYGIAK